MEKEKAVLSLGKALAISFTGAMLLLYSIGNEKSGEADQLFIVIVITLIALNVIMALYALTKEGFYPFMVHFLLLCLAAFLGLIAGFFVLLFTSSGSLKVGG